MNITQGTSQADLMRLTEQAVRRYLLTALPFTGRAIRTMLLFCLFPGMLFGFKQGLILTALTTIAMLVAVALDDAAMSLFITRAYFIWGAVTALGVAWTTYMSARKEAALRRDFMPALREGSRDKDLLQLQQKPFKISSLDYGYRAEVEFEVSEDGVYAFVIEIQNCDWASSPHFQNKRSACLLEWSNKQKAEQAFLAMRLAKGIHQISFTLGANKGGSRAKAQLTQMNATPNALAH